MLRTQIVRRLDFSDLGELPEMILLLSSIFEINQAKDMTCRLTLCIDLMRPGTMEAERYTERTSIFGKLNANYTKANWIRLCTQTHLSVQRRSLAEPQS